MVSKNHILAEVYRFAGLLRGINSHIEQVAADYTKSLARCGKALEDGLVAAGFDLNFLQCLDEIGQGHADSRLLWMDPAKRNILIKVPLAKQQEVLNQGIGGKAIERINPDKLRSALSGETDRATFKKVPVRGHMRSYPTIINGAAGSVAMPAKPPLPGLRMRGQRFPWPEVSNCVVAAIEAGEMPAEVVARIGAACERSLQKKVI
jgi:hypothetical protein